MTNEIRKPEEAGSAASEKRQQRIDAAINRQYERQERSRRLIVALLACAFLAAIAVFSFGQTKTQIVAQRVASDPELAPSIVSAFVNKPAAVESLVSSERVREAIAIEAASVARTDGFAAQLLASGPFAQAVDASSRLAVTQFASQLASTDAFRAAVGEVTNALRNDIDANRETILKIEGQLVNTPEPVNFLMRFEKLEEEQLRLATVVDDETKKTYELLRLRETVSTLQSELEETRFTLKDLERRSIGGGGNRSYLLKENASNSLTDIGLRMTLGRQTENRIDFVLVEDNSGPLEIAITDGVDLGRPFEFNDSEGRVFRATFSYTQSRFWGRDYVGLEIEELFRR